MLYLTHGVEHDPPSTLQGLWDRVLPPLASNQVTFAGNSFSSRDPLLHPSLPAAPTLLSLPPVSPQEGSLQTPGRPGQLPLLHHHLTES